MSALQPRGVAVVVEAEHHCMTMRGVQKPGVSTITTQFTGVFQDDPAEQAKFMTMVRTQDWKMVHFLDEPWGQLFDLKKDPSEVENLWNQPEHAEKQNELLAILREWRIRDTYESADLWKNHR